MSHVVMLSETIGVRAAGAPNELRGAEYIRDELASYGYDATLQPFPFQYSSDFIGDLQVLSPEERRVMTLRLTGSASGSAEGSLVHAGIGRADEFPPNAAGSVALIERGELLFLDKVQNAASAGAIAAIIYNNVDGPFSGDLGGAPSIPAVAVSRHDGLALRDLLASGEVRVQLDVTIGNTTGESHNVVARPPGGECRIIVGGHLDSVPQAPGANDNASGTAVTLEIARVLAVRGDTGGICFVLFGAEEIGLLGSRHYVDSLSSSERQQLVAMLNLDMVGVGGRWLFSGSQELVSLVSPLADDLGMPHDVSVSGPRGMRSDHINFMQAGIPGIMFHRFPDPRYHTSADIAEFVEEDYLHDVGVLAITLLEELRRNPQQSAHLPAPVGSVSIFND